MMSLSSTQSVLGVNHAHLKRQQVQTRQVVQHQMLGLLSCLRLLLQAQSRWLLVLMPLLRQQSQMHHSRRNLLMQGH
jgi:hypothetical protein